MISYLKAKNHKGIDEVVLTDLNLINVICGKNNSGKTSVIEALNEAKTMAIGKKVEGKEWLEELFKQQAERFVEPSPTQTKRWFSQYVDKIISNNTVWFSDETEENIKLFKKDLKDDFYMKRFGEDTFNFSHLFNEFFRKATNNYKSILIPPKRGLETKVVINLNQEIEANGRGLINRLFYQKNQDKHSQDYKIYEKIFNSFKEVTGYEFNIIPTQDNTISLFFRKEKSSWINSDSCGMGLSDILVMISFAIDFDYTFVLIEEPESHIHPEMQKKFLSFIQTIKSRQFIFTTHSNVFLNPYIADKIFYCKIEEKVELSDETSKSEILYNLGYSVSDNFVSDVVVLTEGPTDIPVLSTICKWMGFGDKYNIKYWPLGGDIMADLDLSVFTERNNVIALIDSDPGSKVIRTRFEKKCKEHMIKYHKLKRYSIENYFTLEALRKCFPGEIPPKLTELDINDNVDAQIGFIQKDKKRKTIKTKNYQIIQQMSLNDIESTDLFKFCLKIKAICEEQNQENTYN